MLLSQAERPADAAASLPPPAVIAEPLGDAAEDDSGELPPHLRPAVGLPAAVARDPAAAADDLQDARATKEAVPVEGAVAGGEAGEVAAANGVGVQPNDSELGSTKAKILSRMEEVWFLRPIVIGSAYWAQTACVLFVMPSLQRWLIGLLTSARTRAGASHEHLCWSRDTIVFS